MEVGCHRPHRGLAGRWQRPSARRLGRKAARLSGSKATGTRLWSRRRAQYLGSDGNTQKHRQNSCRNTLSLHPKPRRLGWLWYSGRSAASLAVPTASSHPHSGFRGRREEVGLSFQRGWSPTSRQLLLLRCSSLPQSCSLSIRQTQKL